MTEDDKLKDGIDDDQSNQLEDLEKSFQVTIAGLISDHAFDGFRGQYESIYNAFIKSQKNNELLVQKCRELNSEILANATKINSVLRLSEDDQRTIASLKFEFEKAWKMVEMSQDREQKSRDVIDELKTESTRLAKIVEQNGALAFQEDISLDALHSDINALKSEIKIQDTTLKQLNGDLETLAKQKASFESELFKLKDEKSTLEKDIENTSTENTDLEKEIVNIMQQQKSVKDKIVENRDSITKNRDSKAQEKDSLAQLSIDLINVRKELKLSNDSKDNQNASLALVKGLLNKRQDEQDKLTELIQKREDRDKESQPTYEELQKEVKELDKTYKQTKEEYEGLLKYRKFVQQEYLTTKSDLDRVRKELYLKRHQLLAADGRVTMRQNDIDVSQMQIIAVRGDVVQEKQKVEDIYTKIEGIYNDMLGQKTDITKMDKAASFLRNEIEDLIVEATTTASNTEQIKQIAEQNNKVAQDNLLVINGINDQIAKQIAINDQLIQQRNVVRRQLEELTQSSATTGSDYGFVERDIADSKKIILEKDEQCISSHIKRMEYAEQSKQLRHDIEKMNDDIRNLQLQSKTLLNTNMRSRYLLDVAEKDISKLKVVNQENNTQYNLLEKQIHDRIYSLDLLKEKIVLIEGRLKSESATYTQKCHEVDELKKTLLSEVEKQKKLMDKSKHSVYLRTECRNLEKGILFQQGRVRALEDELETPMNIHRWRFLEASNPELLNLLKMTQELRNKLMERLYRIDKLKVLREERRKLLVREQRKVGSQTKDDGDEEIRILEEQLEMKTKQLQEIETELFDRSSNIDELKKSVEEVRGELNYTKSSYFMEKKKSTR
ncbi:hypothetical protein TVAG_271500 [Trichomonas vaginalis G3]|uniref:Flagellar associated protein n=1 Tax=Trichomonas vaginalis (strain ATCC PRA-98 / G3) TaxID=412133 RepID=A2E5P7_TRIV3|nr:hypothetical protein TVAG_271500 [Trichomonas vaginalis G3]|eukprot:XP_001324190.1 hypothetical protein [Trichomonas vaginalis G3]